MKKVFILTVALLLGFSAASYASGNMLIGLESDIFSYQKMDVKYNNPSYDGSSKRTFYGLTLNNMDFILGYSFINNLYIIGDLHLTKEKTEDKTSSTVTTKREKQSIGLEVGPRYFFTPELYGDLLLGYETNDYKLNGASYSSSGWSGKLGIGYEFEISSNFKFGPYGYLGYKSLEYDNFNIDKESGMFLGIGIAFNTYL